MKNLLINISQKAIQYENISFTHEIIQTGWLGNVPATEIEIFNTEIRLGVKLPEDYIEFLKITNGFLAPNFVEPGFEKITEIDYLINISQDLIESYEHIPELETAILIGGKLEEQQFLLIPPKSEGQKWQYWKFANWIPGEEPFDGLRDYFKNVLDYIINEHEI